jgi:hypothetical protein
LTFMGRSTSGVPGKDNAEGVRVAIILRSHII